MTFLRRLASITSWIVHRNRAERRLDDELRAFVEMSTAERIGRGVPAAEARRLAVIELGGVEQVKEHVRTGRHGALLDEVARDVRYRAPAVRPAADVRDRDRADARAGHRRKHGYLLDRRQPAAAPPAGKGSGAPRAARCRPALGADHLDLSDLAGDPAPRRSVRRRVRVEPVRCAVQSGPGRRNPACQWRVGQRRQLRCARRQAAPWPDVSAVGRPAWRRQRRPRRRDQPRVLARSLRRRSRRHRPAR